MIIILAVYKDKPLLEKVIIIKSGINQAKVRSCSINIFFTAGSNNQAIVHEVGLNLQEVYQTILGRDYSTSSSLRTVVQL